MVKDSHYPTVEISQCKLHADEDKQTEEGTLSFSQTEMFFLWQSYT